MPTLSEVPSEPGPQAGRYFSLTCSKAAQLEGDPGTRNRYLTGSWASDGPSDFSRGPSRQYSLHHLARLSRDDEAMMCSSAQIQVTLPATTPGPPTTCTTTARPRGQRVVAGVLLPRAPLLVKALTDVLRGHQQMALCVQSGRGASSLFSSPKTSKSL